MNKTFIAFATLTAIALSGAAYADDKASIETKATTKIEKDNDGSYTEKRKITEESKDDTGKTSRETTVKASVEEDGDSEKTVKTEIVNDPKGLLNKEKTVIKDTAENKNGTLTTKHLKKVNGETVEEHQEEHATR
jgi:hypothetical protein